MITFTSVMSSLLALALAIFIAQMARELDEELNACGTGVFKDGKCQCVSPYTGTHCELVDCGFGELIDSQFLVDSITTPRYENDKKIIPGCKCDSKFWGYNCANCTSANPTDCTGFCKDNYYGARCDILCKESDAEDDQGIQHEEAGGTYNFFVENPGGEPFGLCQYDGSVKCREGRAGPNCQFQCKACEFGSCNLDDGTCDCFDGYYGEFCEKTCPGRCSGKNGVCQADGKCKCEPGFTGPAGNNITTATEINDCSLECCVRDFGTDLGRVHGECKIGGGCLCDAGWSGDECDCNAEVTCSGRGVCSDGKCLCSLEFQGARCEMCNDTRVGPFCQYDRYQCPSLEMVNGEFVAINSHGDYACKCNAGFMGDHCEMCTPSGYPKSGPSMCTYIVPASLCNRGQVKDDFAGAGVMCDCEINFDTGTDCQNCKSKYFGPDCDIFCDVQCSNSGGTCVNYPEPGCLCPPGKTNVGGVCVVCGGDAECVHGECFRGRCQCDPGYYGDDCNTSAPIFKDKVCNGYTPVLKFETATCDTATDCTSTTSENLANRQVAYRAQQYDRDMFCHRLDTPLQLKDETGCCVDTNFDGKCDKDILDDQVCANGEIVVDICNERVLEGEVNVFEWCLSRERGCTKNGECVDPDLCENRCDLGLAPEEWVGKWERDHIDSMASLMSETWKFPVTFPDPYDYRKSYIYENPCPSTHPDLGGPYYGNQYWCYVDDSTHDLGICNMHDSGVPPPPGGAWGANQPDCELNCRSFSISMEGRVCDENTGDIVKSVSMGTQTLGRCADLCVEADGFWWKSTSAGCYCTSGTIEGCASRGTTWSQYIFSEDEECYKKPVPALDADINDICVSGADYDTCRDYLIPDARVFNMTHMYVDEWKDLPTFETCKFGRYLFATDVNGTKTVALEEPMYAGRIEVISDPRMSAAFARYQNGNESYPDANGDANTMIDSITFFGKGKVEVVVYNYTTEECAEFIRKSAYHFDNCKRIKFYELDYSWSAFCEWRRLDVSGGFNQRCYDQSKVCAGCEDYQEGCEGLPLISEVPAPMPPPCNTHWDDFCDTYLNETAKPTGYCAYAECECDGYAIGGDACNLQCPVPQFTGTEAPCGEDMNPPWGKCNPHIGAIAFGFEQGECDCYNGGSPSVGCAQVCEGEQDCSPDIDTPFSFVTFNCSDIADVQSIEILSETEQRCHVNLRDSVCNYWRGRCECATPFTAFTKLEEPMYFNQGSYRIALMQGYEIDEYAPFVKYVPPEDSILRLMKQNRLCADEYIYPAEDGLACTDEGVKKKNTDWTEDSDGKRCKDYTESDCGDETSYFRKNSGTCDVYITTLEECEAARIVLGIGASPAQTLSNANLPQGCMTDGSFTKLNIGTANCGYSGYDCICKIPSTVSQRYDNKIPSSVACEKNNEYDVEDMTKEECLAFRSFESSTSVSDSDASDVYNDGYEFKTGFRVFDFGKEERLWNLEIFDPGAYCKVKVAGPNGASKGLGCDGARSSTFQWAQGYCEASAGNFNPAHAGYHPNFEDEKLYYKTCCEWTGSECVDNAEFKDGQFVIEQLDASSMTEAFTSNSWSFVDFVGHGNNYVNIKSRFVRVRGIAHHPVKIRPHLTSTEYLVSDTKQGCIKDQNDITYYDFKPDVYTSEKIECSYTFRTFGKCDVSYSKGTLGIRECAEACREDERVMFTMESGECMCGADNCDDFTVTSDKIYHINDNDACGYKFRYTGRCELNKNFEQLPMERRKHSYILKTSGTCDSHIKTVQECSEAARLLGMSDITADKRTDRGSSSYPAFCNFADNTALLLNSPPGTGDCTTGSPCICRLAPDMKTCRDMCHEEGYTSFSMPCTCRSRCTKVSDVQYYTITSGFCGEPIRTLQECEAAAVELGLSDTTVWHAKDRATSGYEAWCHFLVEDGGLLALNDPPGSLQCGHSGNFCICKNSDIYHIQSGYTPHDFIEIKTKSCEHFGHKTINSKELCRNGSLVLGYDYNEITVQEGKASLNFIERIKQAVIRNDKNPQPGLCPEQDFIWDGEFWMGTWQKLTLQHDQSKMNCLLPGGGVVYPNINFDDLTFIYPEVDSVAECKEMCGRKFKPFSEVTTKGVFTELDIRCSKDSNKIKDVIPSYNVEKACLEEDCSYFTPTAIYSDCEPSDEYHYFFKDSGTCDEYITTIEECYEAAKWLLGLTDSTQNTIAGGWATGCLYKAGNTKAHFNGVYSNDCGSSDYGCICKLPKWKKVEKSQTCVCSDAGVGQDISEYFVKDSGTCDQYITTAEECEAAAVQLGLQQYQNSQSWTHNPPGCIESSDGTYLNTNTDSSVECGSAASFRPCICKVPAQYISVYETASPNSAKGCNGGVYNMDPSNMECNNCICLKGQGSYKSDFVEVNTKTCEDHGFYHIKTLETCLEALSDVRFDTKNLAELYFTQTPQYTDVSRGCAKHPERPFSLDGTQPCTEDKPCMCVRKNVVKYELLQADYLCSNYIAPAGPGDQGYVDPLEASDPLASTDRAQECANRCFAEGYTHFYLHLGSWVDGPGRCMCASDDCSARTQWPNTVDSYKIIINTPVETSDRYVMKTLGTCSDHFEITSREECIAAAAIFGVLKNENPGDDFTNHQSGAKCGVWNKYVHFGDATTQCSEAYPCICRLEPPPTVFVAGNCEDFDLQNFNSQECEAYAGEPYISISSGTCNNNGFSSITTTSECGIAAQFLGYTDSVNTGTWNTQPGCNFNTNTNIVFLDEGTSDTPCNSGDICICKGREYQEHTEGTMPGNKCLYVNGVYHFNTGTSSSKCSDRVPCVCKGTSSASVGSCPHGTVSRRLSSRRLTYHEGSSSSTSSSSTSSSSTSSSSTSSSSTSSSPSTSDTILLRYEDAVRISACPGTKIEVIWTGYHNIQEVSSERCDSSSIGEEIIGFRDVGFNILFENDELTARPGQRRFFKCTSHCSATAARFEVYCPDVISRKYGFSEICYPTAKSTPKATREILSEFVTDKYKIEEIGSGMCAPDHDFFFHYRDNPYRITDYKDVPNADACKDECLNTEGCTGFSFSANPTLVYTSVVETKDCYYASTVSPPVDWGGIAPNDMLGNGVKQTKRVSAVGCLQHCEEYYSRSLNSILTGTLYAAGVRWHLDTGMSKGGCACRGPSTGFNYNSWNCNAKSMKYAVKQTPTTCVLSTDGCDEPVLLGDGKCKVGIDYVGKTIEECEQLCIDDTYCRTFSWRPDPTAAEPPYYLSTSNCDRYITTVEECNTAAAYLGVPDTTASTNSWTNFASGCFRDANLYFNTNTQSTRDCSNANYCICKSNQLPNCRVSGRECHYINKRLNAAEDISSDDYPDITTMEYDYVVLLVGVLDHNGHDSQTNSPVCRGDCDVGECASGFTCYQRDAGYPPPPGCADPNNLFSLSSGNDYCVYDEYMSGDSIKTELLDSFGKPLPQVPMGLTCEANGWYTITDELECVQAAQLLLPKTTSNLLLEVYGSYDHGTSAPIGCFYYQGNTLHFNTNSNGGESTSSKKSICRRGWKRYSLGKTNIPGTRYSFTKKNQDLKPLNMVSPLRVGEEYVFEKTSDYYTSDHGVRTYEGDETNPGYDYPTRLVFCCESCIKRSTTSFDVYNEWPQVNNQGRTVAGCLVQESSGNEGRCYCQESYSKDVVSRENIATYTDNGAYDLWMIRPVKKEFLRRKEFAGADGPWQCYVHIASAEQSSLYSSSYPASNVIDNDDVSHHHTNNEANAWLQLNLAAGVKSIASVKIKPRNTLGSRLGDFKLQWRVSGGDWSDCGTYSSTTDVWKTFPCDVNSVEDIEAVRIYKTQSNYMDMAEVKVKAPCSAFTVAHETYGAHDSPSSVSDSTGRARKCGEECKIRGMKSFTVNIETGHCTCYQNRWDDFGKDPFYNSYTKAYFRNDKNGIATKRTKDLDVHHYEILSPRNYRNMHYGKGRYCGFLGSTTLVTGTYIQMQEACYQECLAYKSFLLDEGGNCACQTTKPVCNAFGGVTITEKPWIVDIGPGQCTGSGTTEEQRYSGYSVSREEQILRCARDCVGQNRYTSFLLPIEGAATDSSYKGRCYCEEHKSTESDCNFNGPSETGWHKWDFQMQCTGTSYEHISYASCVSICMDQDCEAFSYSGQECIICEVSDTMSSGTCAQYMSESVCKSLSNYAYEANWPQYAPGCLTSTGVAYWNKVDTTHACGTGNNDCLCAKGGVISTNSRVLSTRIYEVSGRNTYQQFEVLNEDPASVTPPHMGVPLLKVNTLEISSGYKDCDIPYQLISERSCSDLDGEPVSSKNGCEAALAALGYSVTVTEAAFSSEPPGCYYDTGSSQGVFNSNTGFIPASPQKQSVCEVPQLKLTKEQCQEYAEKEGWLFEAEEDIPEYDFVCNVEEMTQTQYEIKTSGFCDNPFVHAGKCQDAMNHLGLNDDNIQGLNFADYPWGCITSDSTTLAINYYEPSKTKECGSAGMNCICEGNSITFTKVTWTPYKTTGICLKNDFPLDIETTETYNYESFTESPCTERNCEKVNYKWTKRAPGCAYKGYSHALGISAARDTHRMRALVMDIRNCVDACVDMLVDGKLGQVNTGVHKMVINRWRGSNNAAGADRSISDNDESLDDSCMCLPLEAARFCDEDRTPREIHVDRIRQASGDYYGATMLPGTFDDYHSITVTAEIKCNYASVFRSFKEFEKSVVTFQTAVDECFKACVTGSMFHRGSLASVGDMNINGFRVEKGTYSNELMASCECVEIPEKPEDCEIMPNNPIYRWVDNENFCDEEWQKVTLSNGKTPSEQLQDCKTRCNNKAGCDGFSFYQGNHHDTENFQCLFANKGCGKRNDAGDYMWTSYVREDMETFKITKEASFEVEKSKYTISSDDQVGSPVFFPKDDFQPGEHEEWFTHLDFTKYSIETNCIGKEPIFDDECKHAQSLFPEWQVQTCPEGFTHIDDFCQKVEEIPNTKCTREYTADENILINITFTGSNGNEDYLVSDGGPIQEDPNLVTCTTFKVSKSFSDHPLNIRNSNGEDVAENLMDTTTLTLQPGIYTYYCSSHPNFMFGSIQVNDCSPLPLFTEVSGNCPEECSKLASEGSLGYFFQDDKFILTHYASGCKCHTTMMTQECSFANNTEASSETLYKIMTTQVNECINDEEMICKEAPQEKSPEEDYMCMSATEVKVFDSNENCVTCGGGEFFDIGSIFFNENGDTDTCVYAEETSICEEEESGWSQYQKRIALSSYKKIDNGYCEGFKDMELDFSDMILSEMIESCATACRAYSLYTGFSISRSQCFCTVLNCNSKIGNFDTFEFQVTEEKEIDVSEIVQKWNTNAPGLRCFKDLAKQDEAPCDWIRALKHFARGGSYRIGDCHNLAPGTDSETQIPCNGHGFPSAGVCACDYAENFELRSSGVGLTFEAPNLRQTPFRGKACEFMCPGYDMYNMESVCSGHGRCETDGRCSCEQGFTGYNCHLACETETKALTCSGHGVCNEREQPLRRDIVDSLNNMECKNDTLYLARDRVIRTGDVVHYMYKSLDGLSIDSFLIPRLITIDFKSSGNTSYNISVDGSQDQENPLITVCQTFTVIKSFTGKPFKIRKNTGETLAYNWDTPQQETFTAQPGRYEYMSTDSPLTHRGFIDVEDCSGKSTRIASIDDFYIRGESVRRPFNSISNFPYMPCKDRINITRETAYHPLVEHTTQNVTVECSLLPGYQDEAYRLVCGMCQCEESQATGFWSGYDCRTPAEGYYANDARQACPGLTADKKPCNGGGTCTWGSIDGLGETTYVDAQCFCGDTTLDSTYATAPRNLDGDMMFHIMNFDNALYVDTLDIVDGNKTFFQAVQTGQKCYVDGVNIIQSENQGGHDIYGCAKICEWTDGFIWKSINNGCYCTTGTIEGCTETPNSWIQYKFTPSCFYGTVPIGFQECQHDWVSNGGVENIVTEAAIVTDIRNDVVLDFDSACDLPGILIDQVKTEEKFLVGNKRDQKMNCAGACFGEYKFGFDGRCPVGGILVLSEDTNPGATWDEKSEYCAEACRSKALPIVGEWLNTANPGFSIKQNGECVCDTEVDCTQIISDEWKHFEFMTPSIFRQTGSIQGKEFEVGPPAGDSDNERLKWCESKCQHFVFDDQSIARGFLYTSTNPSSCVCQAGAGNNILNDGRDRYDYTHFKGFTVNYDVSCKCEVEESCTPGLGDGDRFKILGDIHPKPYTLETRVSIFDGDFICLKNNIIQCKAGPLELTNYNQNDCSCKFGFTGNTCETPRMMCIFSGQETDGTSCMCNSQDGSLNPKVRPDGCCTNGLYWDQIRYSSFSPLVDFDVIPDNIFYYDALKSVCKPGPSKLKVISEGADAVKIHNYAALTDELYITKPSICNFPKEIPMYKAVYKYNSATSETLTLTITKEEIRALGYTYDELFDVYVEEYAKDKCLYRCTRRTVDEEDPFRSFHLRKTKTNFAQHTFLIGDNSDQIRTFDGSSYQNSGQNPGNLDSSSIEPDEIEYCRKSCAAGPVSEINPEWHNKDLFAQGYKATHFAVANTGRCYCFVPLGGQTSTQNTWPGYEIYNMVPDIEYDCTCSTKPAFVGGNGGNSFVEPIFKKDQKVYDIVYPKDKIAEKQQIKCFQANTNLQHKDIQSETDLNLMTGSPSSITPAELNIAGTRVKIDNVENFHECYKACHAESNQIVANSFLWGRRPQIPIVFAGNPVNPYTKLKHCWSHCNSDSDCDTGLKCVTRYNSGATDYVYAWPGCIEPPDADQKWGSGDTISNTDNICYDTTQLEDECYCTVHDPNAPPCTSSFELMGAGYCSNKKWLNIGSYPPVLSEGDANYDADRRRECMNRCLAEYPHTKAFFTKTIDGEERCACAEDYCAERSGSSPYLSYAIQFCETNTRPGFLMEEHTDFYKLSTPKMIVADDVEYDAMPVNPYTCGLESIVHQGDIVSSTCTCPINDFEEVFIEYEYKELTQTGTCKSYYTVSGDLNACKTACDSRYGCNSFSFGNNQCFLAVDCDKDWDVREFAPFFCYGDALNYGSLVSYINTPETCADSTGTVQFAHNMDHSKCYPFTKEFINMDECIKDDGTAVSSSHTTEPTESGGVYTAHTIRRSITQIQEGKTRNDWYYGSTDYKSYHVLQLPRYDTSNDKRYVKQIKADTKEFYCTVGEEAVYTVDVSDTLANDHSCMQKCREEYPDLEFVIARGEKRGEIFKCLCSDFDPDDSVCGIGTPNTFSGAKQYKVSNTPVSSCKCPGFYIFDGQAISCPSGRYSGEDDPCMSSCKLCPRGRFSQVGYTECESCPAGKIQEGLSCTDCPAGQSSPAGVDQCFTCALGLFTDVKGTPSCFDCPNGYYDDTATVDAFTGTSCKICPNGYYSGLATKSTCTGCQTGRYGDSPGQAACKLCSSGKYQPHQAKTSSSDCTNCASGKYQNQNGMPSCKNCPAGQYQSQTGRTGCVSCSSGQYNGQTGRSSCTYCPRGQYMSSSGYSYCWDCGTGKYTDQTGRTSCKNCGTGKYNDQTGQDSSSDCHNCPAGQYNGHTGQSGCTSCGTKYNGYEWGNNPDRTTYDLSCDSHKTNHPSKATMYYDDDYYCNFDEQMAGHTSGRGDMWRRDCWMDPFKKLYNSDACNQYACYHYDDCSNSWDTYYPSGYNVWYYCEASHNQQYD